MLHKKQFYNRDGLGKEVKKMDKTGVKLLSDKTAEGEAELYSKKLRTGEVGPPGRSSWKIEFDSMLSPKSIL